MADAKAEGSLVVVGGFEVIDGVPVHRSRWYSYRLNPQSAPWAFCRKGQAYRVISSLELFASLLCVMIFGEESAEAATDAVLYIRGITDNRSNEALVVKNMTTKFPSYLVLLEFTEQLRRKGWTMELTWVRRDINQLADDLTNEKWDCFDPSLRFDVPLEQLSWIVLQDGYTHDLSLHRELEEVKLQRKRDNAGVHGIKKTVRKKLRLTQPWGD